IAISGMMILKELGIEIGPILAGAGVVGLAVGFGAQNLVKDVISGFLILLEDQIRVGDVMQIADKSGVVEKVTLRMVVLRDISYNVHYIPSGEIKVVTNMTKQYSGFVYDIGVAYRENIDQVIEVMTEIDSQMRSEDEYKNSILEPLEIFGLQEFADSAVIVRARSKTETGKQWDIGREFKKRLKERFDELGIEIPYPHMTVYAGVDKNGQAPPVHISIEERWKTGS
ncbi:MAG TPA: mechanosensitive ion channel family protein, partial [Candidatus Melainabacteria bacterium]|nr:mechanosensitive ion channel family protein [Candidatus Melainabacteria bacterium]